MKTALAIASLLIVAGCGNQTGPASDGNDVPQPGDAKPTAIPAASGPVSSGLATVMDTGRPELCLGGVAESYPPQCTGIPLKGWNWSDWAGKYDQSGDIRWGSFAVTGTFDGTTLTVTGAIPAASYDAAPEEPLDFSTPCPEPDGGWRVIDPDKTTDADFEQVFRTASHLDGYAGAWVDQFRNPPADAEGPPEQPNEGALSIVNVKVTGDTAAAELRLREVWGGMLCVTSAQHTQAALTRVQQELNGVPGMLYSDGQFDRVNVYVVYDDGSLQAWADATYGEGLVDVQSALRS